MFNHNRELHLTALQTEFHIKIVIFLRGCFKDRFIRHLDKCGHAGSFVFHQSAPASLQMLQLLSPQYSHVWDDPIVTSLGLSGCLSSVDRPLSTPWIALNPTQV